MKLILISLSCLLLSGCAWQTIDQNDIKMSNEICAEHEGVFTIYSYFNGGIDVTCKNGYHTRVKY